MSIKPQRAFKKANFPNMSKILQYLKEVRNELVKVVWPSRKETVRMTLVVIAFSVGVAIFLGAIDLGLTKLLELSFKR